MIRTTLATILGMAAMTAPALAQSDDEKRPQTAFELARALGVSGDDTRPENQRRINVLGKPLIVGGEVGASFQYRKDYELVRGAKDDDFKIGPEAKLETIWLLSDTLVTFTDVKLFADATVYKEGGRAKGEGGAELSEAWLLKTNLFNTPLAVQVGRQQFQERREWWWDKIWTLSAFIILASGSAPMWGWPKRLAIIRRWAVPTPRTADFTAPWPI